MKYKPVRLGTYFKMLSSNFYTVSVHIDIDVLGIRRTYRSIDYSTASVCLSIQIYSVERLKLVD